MFSLPRFLLVAIHHRSSGRVVCMAGASVKDSGFYFGVFCVLMVIGARSFWLWKRLWKVE